MNFRGLVFQQFLEDGETISKAFRKNFPGSQIFLAVFLTVGVAEGVRWLFFCSYNKDFCPYESTGMYVYWIVVVVGLYQTLKVYFKWYVNAILMTSESLLFVKWKKLFSPKSRRIDYWDLDSVEVDRSGLKAYMGNFGTLLFHKISGGDPVVFEEISKPHKVEGVIMKNREVMVDEKNFTEESALKDLISQLVQTHVRKNGQPERPKKSQEKSVSKEEPAQKKEKRSFFRRKKHFENEVEEVEKRLDDTGGIDIDL